MGPYLRGLLAEPATKDLAASKPNLLSELEAKNKAELESIEAKLLDAETNLGETEISDALKAKAAYLARIGDKVRLAVRAVWVARLEQARTGLTGCVGAPQDGALAAHEVAFTKSAGLGSKIDLRLTQIRIGFFHGDHNVIQSNIDKAAVLVEEGGDWDRRNRLKAYQGLHLLSIRSFKQGGQLLLDTISTFTATELLDYEDFVVLCVLAGVLTLERKDLKKKVSPDRS